MSTIKPKKNRINGKIKYYDAKKDQNQRINMKIKHYSSYKEKKYLIKWENEMLWKKEQLINEEMKYH